MGDGRLRLVDASFLEKLHVIAAAAGQAVLEIYDAGSIAVDYKGPKDPATPSPPQIAAPTASSSST